jgi:hypothetical protein
MNSSGFVRWIAVQIRIPSFGPSQTWLAIAEIAAAGNHARPPVD